jgi:hypothetical protein
MPRVQSRAFLWLVILLGACGGAQQTLPDERGDLEPTSGGGTMRRRVVEMPHGLHGTQWRWVEAHCTEGPLDLQARGFAQKLRIQQDGESLLLTYDQVFATEQCVQTVVQRVSPPSEPGELVVQEIARVAVPSTPACFGTPEQTRPGEVRRVGTNGLEVLVQRSNWCGGFEVRMVYQRVTPELLTDEEIVRHYVAHFARGDAEHVAQLFAETGSLLDPFTITETGDPYRHDGRDAVLAWLREAFAGVPWRAMRVLSIEAGERPHTILLEWEYMDPRLAQPVRGRNHFTIAAGEIFETQIELLDVPVMVPTGGAAGAGAGMG